MRLEEKTLLHDIRIAAEPQPQGEQLCGGDRRGAQFPDRSGGEQTQSRTAAWPGQGDDRHLLARPGTKRRST